MSKPEPNTIFDTAEAVREAAPAKPQAAAEPETQPELSPSAAALVDNPQEAAFSPIVLAGLVRVIEVCLVAAVGFAVYVCYVVPTYGFAWYYFVAIAGIALLAMLAFQIADFLILGVIWGLTAASINLRRAQRQEIEIAGAEAAMPA
jgi:hypothetical protein